MNKKNSYIKLQGLNTEASGTPASAALQLAASQSVKKIAKFRPWLQDFNMGAVYNADMVEQEIKATQDALGNDYNGFMLWNPSNFYNIFTY